VVPPVVHYHWNLDTPFRASFSSRTEYWIDPRVGHIDRAFDSLALIIIDKSAPLAFTHVESPSFSRSSHRHCCVHPLGLPKTGCSPRSSLTTDEIRLASGTRGLVQFRKLVFETYLSGSSAPLKPSVFLERIRCIFFFFFFSEASLPRRIFVNPFSR